MSNPNKTHRQALNRLWGYLRRFPSLGIEYTMQNTLQLIGYTDASWADDLVERKSTTGYIFFLGNNPISWYSTVQKTIALSSCEAEYMALKDAGKEAVYLHRLLNYMLNKIQKTRDKTTYINHKLSISSKFR